MQDIERELATKFRGEMSALRSRMRIDPSGDPLIWPLPGQLACAQRPLRDHPSFRPGPSLPKEAGQLVAAWVQTILGLGIRAVICLLHATELRRYDNLDQLPDGLLALYRDAGFEVAHLPWADPAHARTAERRRELHNQVHQIKKRAVAEYRRLPKPVLLHCSAGIDRSSPVAAYIVRQCSSLGAA